MSQPSETNLPKLSGSQSGRADKGGSEKRSVKSSNFSNVKDQAI